jgi:hypothetical protein
LTRLRIHDPTAIELQLDVPLDDPASELEAWFFVPAQLGVYQPVFDREQFYRDLTAYVRYQSPRRKLIEADTLLGAVRTDHAALARGEASPEVQDAAVRALRLYGAAVRAQLRRRARAVETGVDAPATSGDPVVDLARDSLAALDRFRVLRQGLRRAQPPVANALAALDDFLSMQALEVWFQLHERAPHPALADAIRRETAARISAGQHGPLRAQDEAGNERFVTQLNRLKKYVLGALHLRFVSTRRTRAAQDLAFGLAAAAAMTVAVLLQLVAAWTFGTPGGPREWASLLPFLGFAVGGYILKDRLKDHLRSWFAQRLPTWLYDRRLELCPEDAPTPLGVCEETVRLVHQPEVPADILAIRHQGADPVERVVRASDGVLHYRRALRLSPAASGHCPEAEAIEQILRFHIHDWVRRMDSPRRWLYQLGDDGHAHRLYGPKTYRVPLVLRVHRGGAWEVQAHCVVLSREGIVRIEPLLGEPAAGEGGAGATAGEATKPAALPTGGGRGPGIADAAPGWAARVRRA